MPPPPDFLPLLAPVATLLPVLRRAKAVREPPTDAAAAPRPVLEPSAILQACFLASEKYAELLSALA
eukprot:CAMPEP_0197620600 /NCGR_PEP_ID=MMETSP1338-20131121/1404_1 /TAXON_ID=43686 ORGANISM="Pelagodinium beii, Strain RCC1491" /NCGR_SAMPLE_ID=MMETSP1338 /ASSEMBLY_ACC=CAM_ASM_000754 /LENGTH=66 /DNA_ID=CAMNT_0043189839 /DNA_START=167 /DNA_END=367 /DNA_ORIENTATION=-